MEIRVARIWRTAIDPSLAGEYETFALERSLPMFKAHEGCCGVLFAADADERIVITLWTSRAAAEALDRSAVYRATVEAIEAAGFLRPPQHVELLDVPAGWLDATATAESGKPRRNGA
jgi:heme-degrading monooxygenase HmoA